MRYGIRQSHAVTMDEYAGMSHATTYAHEVWVPNHKSASRHNRQLAQQKGSRGKTLFNWLVRLFVMLLILIIITSLTIGLVLMGWAFSVLSDTPPLSADNIYQYMEQSSLVYDGLGNYLITLETPVHRKIIPYRQIPPVVRNAFIAIEDERYWEHPGVDLKRLVGVIWINFREGTRQGGSTLNQQLVKNLFLTTEQTYERKLKDIYYGVELQRQLSKEQILEAYLNHIYLGRGAYGVQAAAEVYFNKNARDLTLAEAAYLASIPRNPTRYALTIEKPIESLASDEVVVRYLDNERALIPNQQAYFRQGLVLSAMRRNGLISQEEYTQARHTPLESILMASHVFEYDYSWFFMDMLQKEALEAIKSHYQVNHQEALDLLIHGGFTIHTTMDQEKQRIVEDFYKTDSHFPGYNPETNQPQSAFVLYDHRTGEVKAMIGGRYIDEGRQLFNRAAEPRQTGSAMKTLAAYFPALEHGFSPDVYIKDEPTYLDLDDPERVWPSNWYDGHRGTMTLKEALAQSSNVAAVALLSRLTESHDENLAIMAESLERLGISTFVPRSAPLQLGTELLHDQVYSTVLGGMTYGVSPLEMAAAFGTFANEGVRMTPSVINRIEDASGNVIYRGGNAQRVTSPGVSTLMTEMLKEVVETGTGRRAVITPGNRDIPVAGKTGTTTNQRDAWFVGYTPYFSASVWVGHDYNDDLTQGSSMAAQIWSDLMKQLHEGYPPRQFVPSNDIVTLRVNPNDSKLAGSSEAGISARYAYGFGPTEISTWEPELEESDEATVETNWFEAPSNPGNPNWNYDPWSR